MKRLEGFSPLSSLARLSCLRLLLWVPIVSVLVSCTSIKTTQYASAHDYSPRDPASVEVLWIEPMAPHEHLGEIVLNDSSGPVPSAEVEKTLRKEAAKMGADAVIVVLELVQSANPSFIGSAATRSAPTGQRYKVVGLAIKYRQIKNDLPGGNVSPQDYLSKWLSLRSEVAGATTEIVEHGARPVPQQALTRASVH